MKLNLFLVITCLFTIACGQAPSNYYNSAEGKVGYQLKTALKNIIDDHTVISYNNLNGYYSQTDKDLFYENDGSVLDLYSEKPNGPDAYRYFFTNSDQCGNYNSEADCWNKEHVFPQGFFNERLPMRSDMHHVIPTDGYVNGRRSNYPFGKVNNPTWTSTNGSKVGPCSVQGYTGTCFEPIDEFKGDIARILFYFATRYENEVTSSQWDSHTTQNNPLNGTNNQVYETWYVNLLMAWNDADPVSEREIHRNNKVYQIQGNRNPFIDRPEWVRKIWDPNYASTNDVVKSVVEIFPNPTSDQFNIKSDQLIEKVELYDANGKKLVTRKANQNNSVIYMSKFPSGVYFIKTYIDGEVLSEKVIKK